SLRRMIKGKLHVEFVRQELTSYSGLEVLRRYLRQRELPSRLRAACAATGGDYGGGRLALLVLALLYVGARRLEHLRYVAGDPLLQPAPSQGSQLLSAARPSGSDGPYPAVQEPAGQRPRFQAGRGLPPGGDQRPPRPLWPAAAAGIPHGRRFLPARRAAPALGPGL